MIEAKPEQLGDVEQVSLTAENFHDWIDALRSAGVEVFEEGPEVPEINPLQ